MTNSFGSGLPGNFAKSSLMENNGGPEFAWLGYEAFLSRKKIRVRDSPDELVKILHA